MQTTKQIQKSVYTTHARRRFYSRYKIILDRTLIEQIKQKIKNGDTKVSYRQEGNRSVHILTIADKTVPIIYDDAAQEIVTCLPSLSALDWKKIK